jgi:hypothetical protein
MPPLDDTQSSASGINLAPAHVRSTLGEVLDERPSISVV